MPRLCSPGFVPSSSVYFSNVQDDTLTLTLPLTLFSTLIQTLTRLYRVWQANLLPSRAMLLREMCAPCVMRVGRIIRR